MPSPHRRGRPLRRSRFTLAAALSLAGTGLAFGQDKPDAGTATQRVVITGSTIDDRFGENAREPSSVTTLSGRRIEREHVDNLAQVLKAIPGVTLDTSGGDDLKIKFRGVEAQRYMGEKPGVAIIIDGVPVYERTGKVNINLDNIQSITVIKGGASYLYGEDALAGAIVITTKRGTGQNGLAVEADTGPYDYRRHLGRANFVAGSLSGHVQLSNRQSDDYHFQSGYQSKGGAGNLRWMPDARSDLTLGVEIEDRFRDKHGTVTGVTQAEVDPKGTLGRDYARHFDVALQRINLTYSNDLTPASNLLLLGYEYTDHTLFWSAPQRFSATGAPVSDNDAYTQLNEYHQRQRGLKGEWRQSGGGLALMAGGELKRNRYLNLVSALTSYRNSPAPPTVLAGTVSTDDATREDGEALYGELKWSPLREWTLTGNLRQDRIALDYGARPVSGNGNVAIAESRSFNATSWRVGAAFTPAPDTSVFGNLSTGFRIPTVDQLYRGSMSPTSFTANNPDLRPERAVNVELGARRLFKLGGHTLTVEGALFQIDRKDFILDTNGQYGNANSGNIGRYENIGGARSRGLELALRGAAGQGIGWDLAYTYLDATFTHYERFNQALGNPRGGLVGTTAACPTVGTNWNNCYRLVAYDNTGKKLPRVSPHTVNARANWEPDGRWRLWAELDYRSTSFADEINQNKWPGRTIGNLMAEYTTRLEAWMGARLSLFVRVDNVAATKYWTIARGTNDAQAYATNFRYDGVYNAEDMSITVDPGRVWRAGLSIRF